MLDMGESVYHIEASLKAGRKDIAEGLLANNALSDAKIFDL